MLLSLIEVCDLEKYIFKNMKNFKFIKKRIEEISENNKIANAVNRAIKYLQIENEEEAEFFRKLQEEEE